VFRGLARAVGGSLLVVAMGTAGLVLAGGAADATQSTPHQAATWNPANDYMGSTIKAHESQARAMVVPATTPTGPQGIDVSHWQNTVNWPQVAASGVQFAYMKATEGVGYVDPMFSTNYSGSAAAGLLRGAYHFAHPDSSSGIAQAQYFAANGGSWAADGHTLPPVLDIEYNPSGPTCYGLSANAMIGWISDFLGTMRDLTGRIPTIYTTANWWSSCTGNTSLFAGIAPLWIAGSDPSVLPAGYSGYTFWQYGQNSAQVDEDVFNGATTDLQAFSTTTGVDPLPAHYASLGGANSFLGAPSGSEYATPGGWAQNYAHGVIYYSPATGAWSVDGAILGDYQATGGPGGPLGYPTNDESSAPGGGRFNDFSNNGSIYWSANTSAHEVQGAIRSEWLAVGGSSGPLGFPATDESSAADGIGRFNDFSNSGSIYWSASTGAHEVQGAIRGEWLAIGGVRSPLGYPVTDESAATNGRYNNFSNNGSIYWSASTGAHEVQGAIRGEWLATGGVNGPLGYPASDETGTPDGVGRFNTFQNNGSVYWTASTGAHEIQGAIRSQWIAMGAQTSALGYPTSDEYGITGGRRNDFQHGYITWTAANGAITVGYF